MSSAATPVRVRPLVSFLRESSMSPPLPPRRSAWLLGAFPFAAWAQAADPPLLVATHTLDRVTVIGSRPSTLPLQIPTRPETITRATIEQTINPTDAPDALKYFPSPLRRNRYLGD